MKTLFTIPFACLVVCTPLLAADAPAPDGATSGLSDAELARVTADCGQRCDALFRKQAGKPLVRASIQTDWNGRGDFTREYNHSILLFATRAFHLREQIAEANAALRELCDYHLARPQWPLPGFYTSAHERGGEHNAGHPTQKGSIAGLLPAIDSAMLCPVKT